jgi:protein associated with RNAse G/E
MISKAEFDKNTDSAVELYEKTMADNAEKGIDITEYFKIKWKFNHTDEEKRIIKAVEDMMSYAQQKGIYIHLKNVMNWVRDLQKEVERTFAESRDAA